MYVTSWDLAKDIRASQRLHNRVDLLSQQRYESYCASIDYLVSFIWSLRAHSGQRYLSHVVLLRCILTIQSRSSYGAIYCQFLLYFFFLTIRIISASLSPILFTKVLQIFIALPLFLCL